VNRRQLLSDLSNILARLDRIAKYNPYHDARGRFTTASGVGARVNINDPRARAAASRRALNAEDAEAVKVLRQEQIKAIIRNPEQGGNESHIVTFSDGSKAVFKPASGESKRGLAPIAFPNAYKREVAAYEIDRMLGFGIVPPTTIRTIKGEIGSLQKWVSGMRGDLANPADLAKVSRDQINRLLVLDHILGAIDRRARNFFIEGKRLHAIDNGYSLAERAGTAPSPINNSLYQKLRGQSIPKKYQNIVRSRRKDIVEYVRRSLGENAALNTADRVDQFLRRKKWFVL